MLPSRVLSVLNQRLLLRGIPGRHGAIQYAVFHPAASTIQIASAGMAGPSSLRGSIVRRNSFGVAAGRFAILLAPMD
jgi:hypothetical protein